MGVGTGEHYNQSDDEEEEASMCEGKTDVGMKLQ